MQETYSRTDATQMLLESHTSTDGSGSPKPRWCRGPPEAEDTKQEQKCTTPETLHLDAATSHPSSLQQIHDNRKSYMAWAWLLEDEAGREPSLSKPADVATLQMPALGERENELLCQKVAHRLEEVS